MQQSKRQDHLRPGQAELGHLDSATTLSRPPILRRLQDAVTYLVANSFDGHINPLGDGNAGKWSESFKSLLRHVRNGLKSITLSLMPP